MKMKCKFENYGTCRNAENCDFIHPKKTCQSQSKLGSCPAESLCEHRHPSRICPNWTQYGSCYSGDRCRSRHPIEYNLQPHHSSSSFRDFLGGSAPPHGGGQAGEGHGQNQWGTGAQNRTNFQQIPTQNKTRSPTHQHKSPRLAPGTPWTPTFNIPRPKIQNPSLYKQ